MIQLTVLANIKIIILCQRHTGILVSLTIKNCLGEYWWYIYIYTYNTMTYSISYLDLVPKICPTTRLDTPIPIICMEVARPMAVPRVAWGTTKGIDGHMLALDEAQSVFKFRHDMEQSVNNRMLQNSLQQKNRWLRAIWLTRAEERRWTPADRTLAAWEQHRPTQKPHADPHNPGRHRWSIIKQCPHLLSLLWNYTTVLTIRIPTLADRTREQSYTAPAIYAASFWL